MLAVAAAEAINVHMGVDYNFTNYNFRKTLDCLKIYLARGVKINCLFF